MTFKGLIELPLVIQFEEMIGSYLERLIVLNLLTVGLHYFLLLLNLFKKLKICSYLLNKL